MVRYADDFIVTARDKESLEKVQIQIQQWLSIRGLEFSSEKTFITSIKEGFDFLGFNHRHYDGKLLIKPSKKKVLDFCKRIGNEIKARNGAEQEVVINKLNPILVLLTIIKVQLAKKPLTTFRTECGNTFGVGQSVDTPIKTQNG